MDIKINGGQVLSGEIYPSGSKNSAVALIPATLLFEDEITLGNIPEITDVKRLILIMEKLGSEIFWDKRQKSLKINNKNVRFQDLDEKDLGNMKGTSLLWGPMLARFGKVNFRNLPGGCTLGARPLNPHFDAFRELGVKVKESSRSARMDAENMQATTVWLSEMSPTVTENLIMLACSIDGETKIIGAASEPQVQDLCRFLNHCGADIRGVGSNLITVRGSSLTSKNYDIFPDHYEIMTFLAMGAATGGRIAVHNAIPEFFPHINYTLRKFGIEISYNNKTATVEENQKISIDLQGTNGVLTVKAQPWPALPVDMLPMFIPLALASRGGQVLFHNWMYESGLFWTSELVKMGANIIMADPHRVIVSGGNTLYGATLEAPYIIRAVVAMVISAMIAEGETKILNADALYRGHPRFEENLKKLGAKIEVLAE